MNKKIVSAMSLVAMAILSGCGGGGGTGGANNPGATLGRAYYLDSAVEGIAYRCGNRQGVTDANGTFVFEKGQDCRFYLGDIQLKTIPSDRLKDHEAIIEDNATIAAFLQTLDVDGNASNGIEIEPGVVDTLKREGVNKIPKTQTERRDVWSILKNNSPRYRGKPVDEESALEHVEETKMKHAQKEGHNNQGMHENERVTAWFGDKEQNLIDVVDVDNMTLVDQIPTGHQKTYAAEAVKWHGHGGRTPKMYIDNRGSDAIDVLDSATKEIVKTIDLPFHPRSISVNKETGLVAVSGVDKPMTAIIDAKSDTVIATVGDDNVTYPTTSGHDYVSSGTLACGHPGWLDESHFVLIDRQNRLIKTYKIYKDADGQWQTSLVNTVHTPSPVHDLIPPEIHGQAGHRLEGRALQNDRNDRDHSRGGRNGGEGGDGMGHNHAGQSDHMGKDRYSTIFYATAEGATDVYPAVLKLEFNEETGLTIVDELNITKEGLSPNVMGVHHLNFLKDHKHIYVGSDEGDLFIVNYAESPMRIEKIVPAGKGAGHTAEYKHGPIAVVINHKDRFITVMNTANNTKIADINVSDVPDDQIGRVQTQAHPQYHFSRDGRYFYLFLTEEGALVKVDLQNQEVADRLDIGGKIAMGTFLEH